MQKIMSLAVALIIIYTLVTNKFENNLQKVNSNAASESQLQEKKDSKDQAINLLEGNFLEKSLSKLLINVLKTDEGRKLFENMIRPLGNNYDMVTNTIKVNNLDLINNLFSIRTISNLPSANKSSAYCGQAVTAYYKITDENNIIVKESLENFRLGSKKIINGLENVTVGMKIGETREAIIPKQYMSTAISQNLSSKSYKIQVNLKDIKPELVIKEEEIRVWDDEIAYRVPYLCSSIATFDVKIIKIDGTIIYDTSIIDQKITMNVGDISYPVIFSYALFNKIPVGKRTVLTKGKYLQSIDTTANKIFHSIEIQLPQEEFFIIEFFNFQQT